MRIDVMGVGFDSLTMDEAVARARDLMAERRAAYVVTPNPEIVTENVLFQQSIWSLRKVYWSWRVQEDRS